MKRFILTAVLATTILLFVSCSDNAEGDDAGNEVDGDTPADGDSPVDGDAPADGDTGNETACVPTDESAAPTIDLAAAAVEVLSSDSTAMNTMEEDGSPLSYRIKPSVAGNSCNEAGLIYLDPGSDKLQYLALSTGNSTPEAIDNDRNWSSHNVGLLFYADCTPLVISLDVDDGLLIYSRSSADNWQKESFNADLPGDLTSLSLFNAKLLSDGSLTVFSHGSAGGNNSGYLWQHNGQSDGDWTVSAFDRPTEGDVFDYALGSDGTIHAVYPAVVEFPCDPCDMDLYWGRLDSNSQWAREVVQDSKWADPNDRFSSQASLIVSANNEPLVAACYQQRAITGSLQSSELRVYSRSGGVWCFETAADQQDGYAGGDGTDFTGQAPQLMLDGQGRPYVLFHDQTQWHDSNGANGIMGQARLAIRSADGWTLKTLLEQQGQTESPDELHGFRYGAFTPAIDGSAVFLAGVSFSWDTNSIYNDMGKPINYKLMTLKATLAWP